MFSLWISSPVNRQLFLQGMLLSQPRLVACVVQGLPHVTDAHTSCSLTSAFTCWEFSW